MRDRCASCPVSQFIAKPMVSKMNMEVRPTRTKVSIRSERTIRADLSSLCSSLGCRQLSRALHRQRLYGAVSQTNRIAFSLLRKLNDFRGDDFCGESLFVNYTQ